MNIIEAIILGIIQGLTEFLPVSSSGHIELGKVILNVAVKESLLFSVVVHGATALSTIVIFRNDILSLTRGVFKFKNNEETKYFLKILFSIIPVGLVYVLFKDDLEALFNGNILLVGFMLIITSILLGFTFYKKSGEREVSFTKAFVIGIAQAIAILPGISRSGATISTALLLGVDKDKATRFSFLMVLIPIIGGMGLEMMKYMEDPAMSEEISFIALVSGFLAAFISGLFACSIMIKIVRRGKLVYFAIYCLVVGLIAIISSI